MKLKLYFLYFMLFITYSSAVSQNIPFEKTHETIKRLKVKKSSFKGYINNELFYLRRMNRKKNIYESFKINEKSENVDSTSNVFIPPFENSDLDSGLLTVLRFNNGFWFYTVMYSSEDFKTYYQNIWLQYEGADYFLDSIYNADKKIHASFSDDGKYLLVNTLNTLSDYYNPEQDNRIVVYDLSEIDQRKIKKDYIPCNQCADSYLVGDKLFFTIGRKDDYGGFSNEDIYMAPWGKLEDSLKIASNTDIISISPDGKYLLGSRFYDKQQNTIVVIDVASKKYQMLLGRDYYKHKAFYSYEENKFAFDFGEYLIYVDFPKEYPFNALNWRNKEIPDWTEEAFWKQLEHEPLPGKE